ncbi:MAG: hypothetical protein HC836_10825 [Richelia sp. RM2_1_2]|nr:hypothetical protein [Richelia sp. RM2_1_2]
MPYSVNKKDGTLLVTVNDGSVNTTASSIGLIGRGVTNYGEIMAENLVWMVENFANSTAPANPLNGQIWFNSTQKKLYVRSDGAWKLIGAVSVAASGPVGAAEGDLWWDESNNKLYGWDSGTNSWILIGPPSAGIAIDSTLNNTAGSFGINLSPGPGQLIIVIVNGIVVAAWSNQTYTTAAYANLNGVTVTINGANITVNLPASFPFGIGKGCNLATNISGNAFIGTSTSSLYADIAERYKTDSELEPGDLVKLGGNNEITKTDKDLDPDVFGVISKRPAVQMNAGAGEDDTHPYVALTGRLYVKVEGKIQKGQRLVSSSTPGVARGVLLAEAKKNLFAVFGRSLQDKNNDDIGLIECVVGSK